MLVFFFSFHFLGGCADSKLSWRYPYPLRVLWGGGVPTASTGYRPRIESRTTPQSNGHSYLGLCSLGAVVGKIEDGLFIFSAVGPAVQDLPGALLRRLASRGRGAFGIKARRNPVGPFQQDACGGGAFLRPRIQPPGACVRLSFLFSILRVFFYTQTKFVRASPLTGCCASHPLQTAQEESYTVRPRQGHV